MFILSFYSSNSLGFDWDCYNKKKNFHIQKGKTHRSIVNIHLCILCSFHSKEEVEKKIAPISKCLSRLKFRIDDRKKKPTKSPFQYNFTKTETLCLR